MVESKFYKTSAWKRIREKILRRDAYQCQLSKRYGKTVPATTVHHIFPSDEFPEYRIKAWNLISLSAEAHNRIHDRMTNELTDEGTELLRRTARREGIPIPLRYQREDEVPAMQMTLVIGLPGCGKSTYVKANLGSRGLAYDLDAIASAFRLKEPHEEYHAESRRMANDFLAGFLANVSEYTDKVFVIRTAPTEQELHDINPSRLVVCRTRYCERETDAPYQAMQRIESAINWCRTRGIPVTEP